MKKILFAVLVLGIISCTSKSGNSFTVEGTIKNTHSEFIYLEQDLPNQERPLIVDSSKIGSDGKFKLRHYHWGHVVDPRASYAVY